MAEVLITADQANKLLSTKNPLSGKPEIRFFMVFFQWICITLLLFMSGYVFFNAPSLYLKTRYLLKNAINREKPPIADQNISSPAFWVPEENIPDISPNNINMPDNYLSIPKINVMAPINWNINPDKIISSLESGVVHYQGTALPDVSGNVFVTGHSSSYFWQKNPYGTVFALLGELNNGDRIYLKYQGKPYEYIVNAKNIVKPSNLSVLNTDDGGRFLTLMTCWPIGTNLQRLVVRADFAPINNKIVAQPLKYKFKEVNILANEVKISQSIGSDKSSQNTYRDVYVSTRVFVLPRQIIPVYAKETSTPDIAPRQNFLLFLPKVN